MRSMFVSRSSFENPSPFERWGAHRVAVEVLDDVAAALELGPDEMRDRRLPAPESP